MISILEQEPNPTSTTQTDSPPGELLAVLYPPTASTEPQECTHQTPSLLTKRQVRLCSYEDNEPTRLCMTKLTIIQFVRTGIDRCDQCKRRRTTCSQSRPPASSTLRSSPPQTSSNPPKLNPLILPHSPNRPQKATPHPPKKCPPCFKKGIRCSFVPTTTTGAATTTVAGGSSGRKKRSRARRFMRRR